MINETELLKKMQELKKYSVRAYVVAVLLKRSGGRVSEILGIEIDHLIDEDLYMVKGKKGSNNYSLFAPELSLVKVYMVPGQKLYFGNYNVSTVYRAFVKFGIIMKKDKRLNYSVTHTFRNLRAIKAKSKFEDEEITKDLLHHKSKSSQKHYI